MASVASQYRFVPLTPNNKKNIQDYLWGSSPHVPIRRDERETEKFRIEFLATPNILSAAGAVTNLKHVEHKEVFLERFLDDKNFSLLRKNMWLRQRFFLEKGTLPETILTALTNDSLLNDSVTCLHYEQWKSQKEIVSRLGRNWCDQYPEVFACYHVFRYHVSDNCTVDLAVWDAEDATERHEVMSCRFQSLEDLMTFVRTHGNETIPTTSKLFANLQVENPDVWKMLLDQGIAKGGMPSSSPSFDPPDLSILDEEECLSDSSDCEFNDESF